MNVWVIGAGGLLGSSLVECLTEKGVAVVGTARSQADICHLEGLRNQARHLRPTHIVNCAAYTDVDGAERDIIGAFAVNVGGAANVAEIARECGARLIHISTDYVFSGRGSSPYREEDPCDPVNTYGMSKWAAEKRVLEILPTACVVRTSWVFGGRGKNFISSLFTQFQQKEELQAISDQLSRPTYCRDLAKAIVSLLDCEGIVHFANEGTLSRYQIALDFLKMANAQGVTLRCQSIRPVLSPQFPTVAARPSYSVLSTEKYFQWTATKPRCWDEIVREYVYEIFNK